MKYLKFRGITLVELMLSVALSSFLLIIIISFYQQIKQQNQLILLRLQLQQEAHRLLNLMSKDLKRSGFRASNEKVLSSQWGDNFELFEQQQLKKSIVILSSGPWGKNDCVLFFYDLNVDGCLGNQKSGNCRSQHNNNTSEIREELFGYRTKNNQLQTWLIYKNALKNRCKQEQCQSYLQQSCQQNNGWVGLLDEQMYRLESLSFNWLGKQGIEINLGLSWRNNSTIFYHTQAVVPLLNE